MSENNKIEQVLPKDYYQYLQTGEWNSDKYTFNDKVSKRRVEYVIIYQLVSNGFCKEEVKKIFEKSYNGSYYRKSPKWFSNAYDNALKYYELNRGFDFDYVSDKLLEKCKYLKLSPGARTTFEEIIRICKRAGKFDKNYISNKFLSEATNQSCMTIVSHMKKLREEGFITLVKKWIPKVRCSIYTIHGKKIFDNIIYNESQGNLPNHSSKINNKTSKETIDRKLSKSCKLIYDYLNEVSPEKKTLKEIEKDLSLCYLTVYNSTKKLVQEELIEEFLEKGKTKPLKCYKTRDI
jgi:hypothetical protein